LGLTVPDGGDVDLPPLLWESSEPRVVIPETLSEDLGGCHGEVQSGGVRDPNMPHSLTKLAGEGEDVGLYDGTGEQRF